MEKDEKRFQLPLNVPVLLKAVLSRRSPSLDYSLALFIAIFSLLLTRASQLFLGGPIFIWSFAGTIVAAIILGRGPAIVCAILSAVGLDFWIVGPHLFLLEGASNYNMAFRFILSMGLTLIVSRIVSELRKGYLRAEYLQAEAERQLKARQHIVDIVSHDLRNPLASAQMYTSLLLNNVKAPSEKINEVEVLNGILRSTERMKTITSDLLDASQIELGHFSVTPVNEDLTSIINEMMTAFSIAAKKKRITFEVKIPAVRCTVDRARIIQAMSNLIHNAVKFSPINGVIRITAEETKNDLCIQVSDQGPGIRPDKLEHIFERYWSEKSEINVGTGLGLFIAKGIAHSHGGDLSVENNPDGGASFTLTLPRTLEKAVRAA